MAFRYGCAGYETVSSYGLGAKVTDESYIIWKNTKEMVHSIERLEQALVDQHEITTKRSAVHPFSVGN